MVSKSQSRFLTRWLTSLLRLKSMMPFETANKTHLRIERLIYLTSSNRWMSEFGCLAKGVMACSSLAGSMPVSVQASRFPCLCRPCVHVSSDLCWILLGVNQAYLILLSSWFDFFLNTSLLVT